MQEKTQNRQRQMVKKEVEEEEEEEEEMMEEKEEMMEEEFGTGCLGKQRPVPRRRETTKQMRP